MMRKNFFAGVCLGLLVAIGGVGGTQSRAAEPIVAALQPLVDAGTMPGFVTIVATSEEILSVDCIGWSDREAKKPMQEDSVFWVASMTKAFVGAAAVMMVEEGKLDLDAPITKYIPEFADLKIFVRNKEEQLEESGLTHITEMRVPTEVMTVRQCLNHTAGWRFLSPYQKRWGIDSLDHQHALTVYALTGLDFNPGEKYFYSNIGINVAAAAVERVAGMPLEQLLQERIFDPLEMNDTSFWPSKELCARMATGYEYKPETKTLARLERVPVLNYPLWDRHIRYAEGGGGLFSTGPDYVKFYQMLAAGGEYKGKRILSPEGVAMMISKQTPDGIKDSYGLAIGAHGNGGFGHSGAGGTVATCHDGIICIYMVQVKDIPDQWDYPQLFGKAAREWVMSMKNR